MTLAPILVEPETPACAAMTVLLPISTLWAIWIRLSSLAPSRMHRGAHGGAVDGGVGAHFHVVFDHHIADLRYFFEGAVGLRRKAEAIAADTVPAWITTLFPRTQSW
jgi:hypothetical protein